MWSMAVVDALWLGTMTLKFGAADCLLRQSLGKMACHTTSCVPSPQVTNQILPTIDEKHERQGGVKCVI
jgi:hypothetical protein